MAKDPFWTPENEAAFARIAIDHTRDGIAITSNGERVFVNEAWLNIFKIRDISEAQKIPLGNFAADKENEEILLRLESSDITAPTEPKTIRIFRSDGDPRVLEGYSKHLRIKGNRAGSFFLRTSPCAKWRKRKLPGMPKIS